MAGYAEQHGFDIRCEWGLRGVEILKPACDVVIIIDVLSFTTAVDVAVSRSASVIPTRLTGEAAAVFAQSQGAQLAAPRSSGGLSLSPASLLRVSPRLRLLLPSPNGSALSAAAPGGRTFAAGLRNRGAVADAARSMGRIIGIIPAGERWADGSLRPAWEDLIGAGAVIEQLAGTKSPEAMAAEAAWREAAAQLPERFRDSISGRELIEGGFADDVALAAQVDASSTVPMLIDGAFVQR